MKKTRVYVGLMLVLLFALVTAVFAFGPRLDDEELLFGEPGVCGHLRSGVSGPILSGREPVGPGSFHGGPDPTFLGGPVLARFLNITNKQLHKMREMADRSFEENRSLRYELLQKELEMQMLLSDPKVEETTLLVKQKELSALHQKFTDKIFQVMIAQRKALTPKQIQKLDRLPLDQGRMRVPVD